MIVYTSTKPLPKSEATLRGGSPDATSPGYDPKSLRNRPFHRHELRDDLALHLAGICHSPCPYCPRPTPGKPQLNLTGLLAKYGRK